FGAARSAATSCFDGRRPRVHQPETEPQTPTPPRRTHLSPPSNTHTHPRCQMTTMVTITACYDGSLRCTARHGPSDSTLETHAPLDNHGRGESFSPTDLLATALLTCTITTMAIAAKRANITLGDVTGTVEKHMVAVPNRRVGALPVRLTIPGRFTPEQMHALE